ncbi:PD-(D/E)XK nuclease family protein [Acinetobacter sp.]|uniref:PDDEXK-like family protein n=1 Tax=Acinetobacter sp. TaxID=472 RepID=UPI003D061C4D
MQEYIDNLIKQIVEIINKDKDHGDYFNLLMLSGVGSSEVFTHTPILKELLDPTGSHGQKDLFLKSFIDYFELVFEIDHSFAIKREFRCEQGQIDLLLENKNKVIIIENKIYAADQSKQLNRYYDYCIERKKIPLIIYLTLQGNEPTKFSLGKIKSIEDKYFIEKNNEIRFIDLQCLSYREDISGWLESTLSLIKETPNIKAALNQYLNLLKMLTGKLITVNKELKKMLIDITPVELEAIRKLSNQFNSSEYRGELLYKLFEYFEKKLVETGNFEVSDDYLEINYTLNKCQKWFKQISSKNKAEDRDIVGCVLRSKINPKISFLFIAATSYMHYGIILDDSNGEKLKEIISVFPNWDIRMNWKKIEKPWISCPVPNLRDFSDEALKLLTIKDNYYLDNFINERINELETLNKLCN